MSLLEKPVEFPPTFGGRAQVELGVRALQAYVKKQAGEAVSSSGKTRRSIPLPNH